MADMKTGCGWELHCTTATSDKFYRVLVLSNGTVVRNWGRRGATGQFKVTQHATREEAIAEAQQTTVTREEHGYALSVDFTEFTYTGDYAMASTAFQRSCGVTR